MLKIDERVILDLAAQLGERLKKQSLRCVVAESCTGGRLASAITDIPGSSAWFDRGYITYSNQAKTEMLGVSAEVLAGTGAVSEATVCAMASGAIAASGADMSIAISGVAGPSGGSAEKPVGLVWISWALKSGQVEAQAYQFEGDRLAIRLLAVENALKGLIKRCDLLKKE